MTMTNLRRISAAIWLTCALTMSAFAETLTLASGSRQVALVELYTSEGCSSCPPADRFVTSLKSHPGLWQQYVPVAFHVDYWDYLGWQDPYAKPAHSVRQRTHKKQGHVNAVYTPGFVVDGQEWRGFFTRADLPSPDNDEPGNLVLEMNGNSIRLRFSGDDAATAHVVLLGTEIATSVRRGENAGQILNHDFVVLSATSARSRNNVWSFTGVTHADASAIAAWVTARDSIRPLQAVGGWLRPVTEVKQ